KYVYPINLQHKYFGRTIAPGFKQKPTGYLDASFRFDLPSQFVQSEVNYPTIDMTKPLDINIPPIKSTIKIEEKVPDVPSMVTTANAVIRPLLNLPSMTLLGPTTSFAARPGGYMNQQNKTKTKKLRLFF